MQIHCTTTQATGLRNWASTSWRCGDKLPLQLFVLQGLRCQCCGSGTHFIHQLVANIIWHMGGCTACRHLMHQMPRLGNLYFQNRAYPLNQQLKSLAAEEHGITFSTIQGFWRSPDGLSRAPSQRFHIGWHTSWAQPTLPGIPEIQTKRQAMSDRCGSSGLCQEFYSNWILLERINRLARHIRPISFQIASWRWFWDPPGGQYHDQWGGGGHIQCKSTCIQQLFQCLHLKLSSSVVLKQSFAYRHTGLL